MTKLRTLLALLLVFTSLHCTTRKSEPPATRSWMENMTELSETLADLLPLTSQRDAFLDEANRPRVTEITKRMARLAREVNQTAAHPDADPSLKFFTELFAQDMTRAEQALNLNQLEYSRQVLRNATNYCISCHSRSNDGPEFTSLKINQQVTSLGPVERAEFFAATRQFTRAAREFEDALKSETVANTKPFDWEQAARFALALNIRVRHDPKGAMDVVNALLKSKQTAPFMKQEAKAWKKSLQAWMKEPVHPLTTTQDRLNEAKRLIARAKKSQKFPLDRSGDIDYLRASAHLHDILRSPLNGDPQVYQEAIFDAGLATEAVRDLSFWSLHETYYEICIRYTPHTQLANQCFEKLQASVQAGYSGSSGTSVPGDVQKRLNELKELAK